MGDRAAVAAPALAVPMVLTLVSIPVLLNPVLRAARWAACQVSGWMVIAKTDTGRMVTMGKTEPDSPGRRTKILTSVMQMPQPLQIECR